LSAVCCILFTFLSSITQNALNPYVAFLTWLFQGSPEEFEEHDDL
jgi:hypothetical protein